MSDKSLKRLTHKPKEVEYSEKLTQMIYNGVNREQSTQPSILKQVEDNKAHIAQTNQPGKQKKNETSIE
jgi:hypothetical protein